MFNLDEPEPFKPWGRAKREEEAARLQWQDVCKGLRKEIKALRETDRWRTAEFEDLNDQFEILKGEVLVLAQAIAELEANQ